MKDTVEERESQILSAIARIHSGIAAGLELEEVSRRVVQELVEIVNCAACAVLLIEGNEFRILAERDYSKMCEGGEFSAERPEIKHIVDIKRSLYTGQVKNSVAHDWAPPGYAMNSLIDTPILVSKQVKGIIHLDSPLENAFDEQVLHFVELMAQEMSIALVQSSLYKRVKTLTVRDDLTGCLNRRKLDEDIEEEIARAKRYEKELSLLLVDIGWLKNYNESYGQAKGSELLKKMIDSFRGVVRVVDKLYRYGGKEFAIVLPETGKQKALFVAKRLQKIIEEQQEAENAGNRSKEKTTVNMGIACYPSDGNSKDELLRSAETALYRATLSGKNKVYVFDRVWARSWTN
jgi:diguanylate cyclase (GGDEF)-like protein